MENESGKFHNEGFVSGIAVQTGKIAFRADEMIACAKCGKQNPPNRASCIYCGTPIELPEDRRLQAKLNLRSLENWEKGFNIVFVPPVGEPDAAAISSYLSIDPEVLGQMFAATVPFPIARLESEAEAMIAVQQLEKFRLKTAIVSDGALQADRAPTRLRGMEFRDGSIVVTAFNTGNRKEIGHEELVLIVTGAVIESKREAVEKRKKKETELLQETETISDEKLIDIYVEGDDVGFRIPTKGFDFSCLGAEKGLLAGTNLDRLLERLATFSATAKMIEEYRTYMNILGRVWEIDRQKDFQGLKKTGIGQSGFANVARTNNLMQFTKYSRLQRHLL